MIINTSLFLALLALVSGQESYGDDERSVADFDNDWATYHLALEHHLDNFDAGAFFDLHDFEENAAWAPNDVLRMYGLEHESNKDIATERREEVTRSVFSLYDDNHNGMIERDEFLAKSQQGVRLPDFGLGPGHHGDDEYEYEIHHFEKYHDENSSLEDLNHPEDIAHFAKHDREDEENERIARQNEETVVEANIPDMFRRKSEL